MHNSRLARLLTGALLATTGVVGVAAAPVQAAQSSPTCNGATTKNYSGFYAQMPTYNGSVTCTLFPVVKNSSVTALQRQMNACYGESLALDGSYGTLTAAAMTRVQKRIGAGADGEYGPNTRSRMAFYGYTLVNGNPRYSCRVVG